MDYLDKLADIKKQLDAGIITEAEFNAMKTRILAQADGTEEEVSTEPERGLFALYFSTLKKAFRIKGRANRTEYFLFTAVNGIIALIISLYLFHLLKTDPLTFITIQTSTLYNIVNIIVGLFLFIANFTLLVRRFHDFNRSGWFAVAPWLGILASIPLMLIFIGIITMAIAGVIAFIWSLMAMFKSGTPYTNVYGAKPRTKRYIIGMNWVLYLTNIALSVYLLSQAASFLSPDLFTNNSFKSQFMGNKQAEQFIDELSKIDQNPEYGLTLPESAEPTSAVGSAPRPSVEMPEMSKGIQDAPTLTFDEMNKIGEEVVKAIEDTTMPDRLENVQPTAETVSEPVVDTTTPVEEAPAEETPVAQPTTEAVSEPVVDTTAPVEEAPVEETPVAQPTAEAVNEPVVDTTATVEEAPATQTAPTTGADIMAEAEKFLNTQLQEAGIETNASSETETPLEFGDLSPEELEKEAQAIDEFINAPTVDGSETEKPFVNTNTYLQ